jgi:hypothetical protein
MAMSIVFLSRMTQMNLTDTGEYTFCRARDWAWARWNRMRLGDESGNFAGCHCWWIGVEDLLFVGGLLVCRMLVL